LRLPTNPPAGVNFTKAGIFVATRSVMGKGPYRALGIKVYQRYDWNTGQPTNLPQPIPETDYRVGWEFSRSNDLPLTVYYPTLGLRLRHNALLQRDTYEVYQVVGTNRTLVASQTYRSELAQDKQGSAIVGLVLAGKPKWSGSGLAMDNWSIRSFDPGSTNLPAITQAGTTIGGSAWTLTITDLRLVKGGPGGAFVPTATGRLAFGTNTLSIPATGSILTNGTFSLIGRGSGSSRGYGFSLVYDTYNSVRITGKTTVTAPKQKTIKF